MNHKIFFPGKGRKMVMIFKLDLNPGKKEEGKEGKHFRKRREDVIRIHLHSFIPFSPNLQIFSCLISSSSSLLPSHPSFFTFLVIVCLSFTHFEVRLKQEETLILQKDFNNKRGNSFPSISTLPSFILSLLLSLFF